MATEAVLYQAHTNPDMSDDDALITVLLRENKKHFLNMDLSGLKSAPHEASQLIKRHARVQWNDDGCLNLI